MSLFKYPERLEESTEYGDQLNFSEEIDRLRAQVERWLEPKKTVRHHIIAYIGRFGTGKSSILKQLHVNSGSESQDEYYWLPFEIWRYADRQQIWDGFAVETIALISGKSKVDVVDLIDGDRPPQNRASAKIWRTIREPWWPVVGGLAAFALWIVVGVVFWAWLWQPNSVLELFLKALLKYAVPVLFLVWALVGIVNVVPKSRSPIKRVFELQDELARTLKTMKKPLLVVVEDVDRSSNDEGLIFLEALKVFLNDFGKQFEYPIIVIAPQDRTHFNRTDESDDKFQRSLKIYDRVIFSQLPLWEKGDLGVYYRSLGTDPEYEQQLVDATNNLVRAYPNQLTIRLLKFILREVYDFHGMYPKLNPVIVFILVASRYVKVVRLMGMGVDDKKELASVLIAENSIGTRSGALSFVNELVRIIDIAAPINDVTTYQVEFDIDDNPIIEPKRWGRSEAIIHLSSEYEQLLED